MDHSMGAEPTTRGDIFVGRDVEFYTDNLAEERAEYEDQLSEDFDNFKGAFQSLGRDKAKKKILLEQFKKKYPNINVAAMVRDHIGVRDHFEEVENQNIADEVESDHIVPVPAAVDVAIKNRKAIGKGIKEVGKGIKEVGKLFKKKKKKKKVPTANDAMLEPLKPLRPLMVKAIKAKGYSATDKTSLVDVATQFQNRIVKKTSSFDDNWYEFDQMSYEPVNAFSQDDLDGSQAGAMVTEIVNFLKDVTKRQPKDAVEADIQKDYNTANKINNKQKAASIVAANQQNEVMAQGFSTKHIIIALAVIVALVVIFKR